MFALYFQHYRGTPSKYSITRVYRVSIVLQ